MKTTVLIIEDHESLRRSLRGWIEMNFPGCYVLEAGSGEEAIIITQTNVPQIALVDIGLPGMSGLETAAQIKTIRPSTQVIILTIYEDDARRAGALASETQAYVLKDKLLTELQPVLASLLLSHNGPAKKERGGISWVH